MGVKGSAESFMPDDLSVATHSYTFVYQCIHTLPGNAWKQFKTFAVLPTVHMKGGRCQVGSYHCRIECY